MWYDQAEGWIGFGWAGAALIAWLVPYSRGFKLVAWVLPLSVTLFCLGLYVGIETTAMGKFKLPVCVVTEQMRAVAKDYPGESAGQFCPR